MKKTLLILGIIALVFAGCKKFDEIEASKVEIIEETIERGWDYIKINVEYDYPVELETVTLYLSEKEDLSGAKTYKCDIEGKTFSVEVYDLKDVTKYYYQFEYDNGYGKERSEKENFMTIVVTKDVTNITPNSAVCGGNVTDDGNGTVTVRGVCWNTSQNPTINNSHTTDGNGTGSYTSNLSNLTPNTTYYVRAYATNEKRTSYGEERIFKTESLINGHDWVDLGLPSGLKWATCNVGASSPEEYGNYYAWGETEPAPGNNYSGANCEADELSISELQSQGIIDGDHNLTPSHDAATANWGGIWRMPTEAEQQELLNNCTWEWTVQGGKNGCKVTGPNGNNIFLPAAGGRDGSSLYYAGEYGHYWSSTPYESSSNIAFRLYFDGSSQGVNWYRRYYGLSVRPVAE